MKLHRHILLFVLVTEFYVSHPFNIELAPVARRGFVRSEGIDHDGSIPQATTGTFFGYSFRGNLIKQEGRNIISVLVSAPLQSVDDYTSTAPPQQGGERVPTPLGLRSRNRAMKATKSTGVLYACDMLADHLALEPNKTDGIMYNCSNIEKVARNLEGSDISIHDTLGATLVSDRRANAPRTTHLPTDSVLACAPLRAYNCSSNYKAEGACYISKVVAGRGDGRVSVSWRKRSPCREECTQSDIDLMFLVDGSESITKPKFETVKDWIINVASGFDLTGPVQVGVVQYSHWYKEEDNHRQPFIQTEIELGQFKNHADFKAAVRAIKFQGFTTFTAHAITKVVRDDFNSSKSRYPSARRVMILLTDGNSTDREQLDDAVAYSRDNDVTSFAVGVKGYLREELLLIAGSESRVITVENFNELQGIVEQIQFGIQLLEGSSNPNATNGLMQCQAGISSDMSEILEYICAIVVISSVFSFNIETGKTALGKSRNLNQTYLFWESQPDNVLIVGGRSSGSSDVWDYSQGIDYSTTRDIKVKYGCNVTRSNLEMGSSCVKDIQMEFPISSRNLSSIGSTSVTIRNYANNGVVLVCLPQSEQICHSQSFAPGACFLTTVNASVPSRNQDSTSMNLWREMSPCAQRCTPTQVDLAFVVDGSSSVKRGNFERVLIWMQEISSNFDISSQYRIAVVKYSRPKRTRVEIQLGQFHNQSALSEAIANIKYTPGGSFASFAIDMTVDTVFKSEYGRYPNARRVMIFLTDGKSSDVAKLNRTTEYSRENDVEAFAVGIADYRMNELLMVAGNSSRIFTEENYENLSNTISKIKTKIRQLEGGYTISQSLQNPGLDHCGIGTSVSLDVQKVNWSNISYMCAHCCVELFSSW